MAQPVKFLPSKCKDLSSIPKIHCKDNQAWRYTGEYPERAGQAAWPNLGVPCPQETLSQKQGRDVPSNIPEKVLSVPETHMLICGPMWIHNHIHKKVSIEKIALPMAKAKCKRQQVWYPRRGDLYMVTSTVTGTTEGEDENHVRSVCSHIHSEGHH